MLGLVFSAALGGMLFVFWEESGTGVKEPVEFAFLPGANACTNQGKITAGTNKPKQQLNTNRNNRFIPTK